MTVRVSVIIPMFNSERYLSAAIESVLQQTMKVFELIVVDDGSTDHSVMIANSYAKYGVRVVQQAHRGAAVARNLGVSQATGDYIAFIDSDDYWTPDKLEKQLDKLRHQPYVHGVFGYIQQFLSPELSDIEKKRYQCVTTPQPGYSVGCLLMKRDDFLKVGLFSDHLQVGEFIEWYVCAQQQGFSFAMLDDVVLHRRIHGRNMTLTNPAATHTDYLKIIRKKLQHASSI